MTSYIACIPARGGSKGLPEKNILDLYGIPLIGWSILFALSTKKFSRVLVSTDCPAIAQIAKSLGAEIPFLRSPKLASDTSTTSDVILDLIERCNLKSSDRLVLLEPTSPYRIHDDFDKLVALLEDKLSPKVISVSEAVSSSYAFQYFLGSKGDSPMIPILSQNNYPSPRRQDISSSFFLDGTFYASRVDAFVDNPTFLDQSTSPLVVNPLSTFEIDTLFDLQLYRAIYSYFGAPSWYLMNN